MRKYTWQLQRHSNKGAWYVVDAVIATCSRTAALAFEGLRPELFKAHKLKNGKLRIARSDRRLT